MVRRLSSKKHKQQTQIIICYNKFKLESLESPTLLNGTTDLRCFDFLVRHLPLLVHPPVTDLAIFILFPSPGCIQLIERSRRERCLRSIASE